MATWFLKISSNGNKILKSKLMTAPSYMIICNFSFLFSIVPLFLNERIHFATTIKLVLTSQLCLYTLFKGSQSDIPKTAYLKHIDFWNVGVSSVSLINFFTLIFWEMLPYNMMTKKIKNTMKIGIPILTLFGVICYWMMAGLVYFDAWKNLTLNICIMIIM